MRLKFATGNPHKFKEAGAFLSSAIPGLELEQCTGDFPEIQADNLEEVARFKIMAAIDQCGGNIFMEDAGLFIPALNGFPGVYSAPVKKMLDCKGILRLLEGIEGEGRAAYFKACTALFLEEEGEIRIFTGEIHGIISKEERGSNGFGFDPIFVPSEPEGNTLTFAEMTPKEKIAISHRTRALAKLRDYLSTVGK